MLAVRRDGVMVDRGDSRQPRPDVGAGVPHVVCGGMRVRCCDLNPGREHAGKRCCEGGGLEGTTMLVLISQNVLSFRFVDCPATPLAKEAKGRLRPKSLGSAECVRSLPLFPDFSLGRSRAVRPRRIRRSGGSRLNPD